MLNIWMEMILAVVVSAIILSGMELVKAGCRLFLRKPA